MTDFGPGKDRISIPDSRAKALEALRDTGVHGGFDRWGDDEDQQSTEEGGGVPLGHGRSSVKDGESFGRGGGEGGYELLVEDPTSNPEMGSLLKDFLREKHPDLIKEGDFQIDEVLKLGKEFDTWQNSDSTQEEWENAPKEREKLKKSEELRKLQELNLKMFKEKQDVDFMHLEVIPKALEKFATEDEVKVVQKFQDIWRRGKDIQWVGFEIGKSKENSKVQEIKDIGIGVKGADEKIDYTRISAHLARNVFKGINKSNKPGTDIVTGLAFVNPFSGMREAVYPGVRVEEVAKIMKRVKLGGKTLPDNVKFFIGNEFQK